ncbi:sex peptide receptor-like [Anopheles albimanus]|uniref:G-protein coupled receptors family 1 profile domain-containing protein n=1 Tax=Anopheles albimanus TaxID=7167 RepID=A0A182FB29_ANOAL|nr:sex peptide receptor-like [Anopheles albimanus]XP_035784577.1 sex peptide receptor-like [Anopheles albimanus]XP_035784578.1 sex peptide receptor-like [Anopheles albimanus]XP_035784581.1 sex peptide receptor-like [Anopheles albimanus]XP_035784582.1 sex peptide receptor-like [Anopheles albimanus]XP_035784583.1 sex peptide receptor-like [Anopheles albimanus]XP_035784584.1 sex peptide receptor-like [Anopheles albimanus]
MSIDEISQPSNNEDGASQLDPTVPPSFPFTSSSNRLINDSTILQYKFFQMVQPQTYDSIENNSYIPSHDGKIGNDSSYNYYDCVAMDGNVSYLNVSCETILSYSIPLYGYCTPVLLLITLTANSLIVIVLSKRSMASPTNFVLMAMALCDLFTVLFPAPGLLYMYTFGNHYKPLSPLLVCYIWNALNEILPAMFHTASVWLTLALAVQRYIYVCHAPTARTWCTIPRVKNVIASICIAAFFHQSSRFFDKSYSLITIEWNGQETSVCHIETAEWVHEYISEDFYYTFYFSFRILFVHLAPCASLVALNVLLFRAMKQAQRTRDRLFKDNKKRECKRLRDSNCTTLMLIVVVTVFLIVEIPLGVITALHILSSLIYEFLDYYIANLFILFANFFLIVSYPINFAIYCGMSRQFRETFKEIFIKSRKQIGSKKECGSCKYSFVNQRTFTNETVL